jgi:CoA:oxalate CoA-transferase
MTSSQSGPLDGVRVLALEQYLAGNHGTWLMSMFGADVVKVERPGSGDVLRGVGPFVEDGTNRRSGGEMRLMGNKRSIGLDITTEEGKAILLDLVAESDVVWTNQKPSTMERLGLTFEAFVERNPQIIYGTLSGFGHDDLSPAGPLSNLRAFDVIAQGLAGLQFRSLGPDGGPGYNGLALGDEVTSMLTVLGVVLALYRREREGGPQRVDVAMHDAMVFLNELALGMLSLLGRVPPRGRSGTSAPYGAFKSKDGWVNIAVGGDPVWRRFCIAIQRPDLGADDGLSTSFGRVQKFEWLDGIVSDWTGSRTSAEIVSVLSAEDVPCAPILDIPEVLASEQVAARGMLLDIDDPIAGPVRMVGNPVKMNGLKNPTAEPPHTVGQDTIDILIAEAGLDRDQVEDLVERGIVSVTAGP